MKRSEALLKLQRHYSIRHCMVEQGYITKDMFCNEALQLLEDLMMEPPRWVKPIPSLSFPIGCNEWEPE